MDNKTDALRAQIGRYFSGKEATVDNVLCCFLAGGHLVVVSPYFNAVMRDFCRSMQAFGFEVVFWITSSFSSTEGIPEDVPLYYRTYRGSAEEA